jgi:hypothetical protein
MVEVDEEREVAMLLPWLLAWDTAHYWGRDAFDATHGVTLRTTPDPGWILEVHLEGTELETASFREVDINAPITETIAVIPANVGDRAWLTAAVADSVFTARGSPLQLTGAIALFSGFARWARNGGSNDAMPFAAETRGLLCAWANDGWHPDSPHHRESALVWLQRWFADACDGEWERTRGVHVDQLDNPGWTLKIDLTGTRWAGRTTARQLVERDEHSWLGIKSTRDVYEAVCGPLDLVWAIDSFREWLDSGAPSRVEHL